MTDETLTLPNVQVALTNLTSGSFVKQAETILLKWQDEQTNPYTYLLLCATLESKVRLGALLSLKAVIIKTWKDRGRRQPRIFLEEKMKQQVRVFLLSLVTTGENPLMGYRCQDQIDSTVADTVFQAAASSCLVQIARSDLPKQFHDLIPTLVTASYSQSDSDEAKRNAVYALQAIVEELAAKRTLSGKQYIASIGKIHLESLVQGCLVPSLQFLVRETNDTHRLLAEYATLSIRTIHDVFATALPYLLEHGETCNAIERVFAISLEFSTAVMNHPTRMRGGPTSRVLEALWDMVVSAQDRHPMAFGRYLKQFLGLFYVNVVAEQTEEMPENPSARIQLYATAMQYKAKLPEPLMILALRFLANVASSSYYVPDETANEAAAVVQTKTGERFISSKGDAHLDISNVQNVVHTVWNEFFTNQRVCILSDLCVCRYMILSKHSLSEWNDSPEAYFLAEEHRAADEDIATAAQNLFCSLAESKVGQNVVVPRLVNLLRDTKAQQDACLSEVTCSDQNSGFAHPSALLWESIYTASGMSDTIVTAVCSFFNDWYSLCLAPCLVSMVASQYKSRYLPILRRRIIWLVGCFSHVISRESRPIKLLSDFISEESSPQSDLAVRLSAVLSLKSLLYDLGKSIEETKTMAHTIISSLYQLAAACEESEAQLHPLECVSLVLTSIIGSGHIISYEAVNAAVIPLPSVWSAAPFLRSSALLILSTVAISLGKLEAEKLYQVAFGMIDNVLSNRDENASLVSDALILWLTLLRLAQSYSRHLDLMFAHLKDILDNDFEHLRIVMMLTECYILIGRYEFLANDANAQILLKLLQLTVGHVRPKGAMCVALVLEALLRGFPEKGSAMLFHGGIVETMVQLSAANFRSEKQCEPDRVIVLYLTALARITLHAPQLLNSFLQTHGASVEPNQLVQLYFRLFDHERYDGVNDKPLRQKLWLFSLLSLLPESPEAITPFSISILESFEKLLSLCLEMFTSNFRSDQFAAYTVGYDSEEETIDAGSEQYDALLASALSQDVAFSTDVVPYFKIKMSKLSAAVGYEAHQRILSTVEPIVLRRLEDALK